MGCFGSCNCSPCCMDAAELAEIATSVTILKESETDTVSFVSNGCCHTATATDATIYYTCNTLLVAERYINETIQVSSKMIKSKKLILDPPGTYQQNDVFCTFFYDEPVADPEAFCNDVYNCGTVNRAIQQIDQRWIAVRWAYGETKVSIYKVNTTCDYGGAIECKYVVECAVEVRAAHGAGSWSSLTKTASMSAKNTCCKENIQGYDFNGGFPPVEIPGEECTSTKPYHDPPFNCPNDVEFGAEVSYWLIRYRVYDAPEDIPATITFSDTDINECNLETCVDGVDSLCFYPIGTGIDDDETGGTIMSIGYSYNCQFCFNIGIECDVCAKFNGGYPCSCDPGRETDRTHSEARSTDGDGYMQTFNTVKNPYLIKTSTCHNLFWENYAPGRWGQDCESCDNPIYPGPPEDEQNECNYWDCIDCYFSGADPIVPVYQMKIPTVEAYTFSLNFTKQIEPTDEVCIPFPTVVVTLNT